MKKIKIYFAEFFDEEFFNKKIKNYTLFDKESFKISKNSDLIGKEINSKSIFHIFSQLLENYENPIIYLLYTSDPEKIIETIEENINSNKKFDIEYNLFLEEPTKIDNKIFVEIACRDEC
jgi:hypothetical protein